MNIACGERTTLNEIVAAVNTALGTKIAPEYKPARAGDVRDSLADISAAEMVIGYRPQVFFDEGLKKTCD